MNKRQEALRRGLRSFIEDTSRELADLEGRPLRPPRDPQAAGETVAVSEAVGVIVDGGPGRDTPEGAAPVPARTEPPGREAPGGAPSAVHPAAPAAPLQASTSGEHASQPVGHVAGPEQPAQHHGEAPARPAQAGKPKRRARTGVHRRPRAAAEIGANGVSPAQAHARKGVCFAYFRNHECWRVPDAYCNSALQVCITRECPIYHLHKDALERRFARKFRHFW